MVVDSSAVAAIFLRRPGHERLIAALARGERAGIGAPTLAEASLEISLATGRDVHGLISRFVQELDLTVIPFSDAHSRAAAEAFRLYGKKRSKAGLELGECLSYATARLARQPLLADDARFAKTDLDLV
ncbi:MAG TPA: type II toxin-antitoxin system VapC family toxin [Thermoanaerobaculia bacterium]|nr:type II toxin-antitoxin system VapC family toxin [Thermoanaerobaculia bacterium]